MDIDKCICPNCKNKLLYIQSKLNGDRVESASMTVNLQYAINCRWCKFEFGDYNSQIELFAEYKKQYGGVSNVKSS